MNANHVQRLLLGAVLLCTHLVVHASGSTPGKPLLIVDVTVIDPQTRRVMGAQDVYIEDGIVVDILPNAPKYMVARAGNRVLDGSGKYLVPGFMDMHAHIGLARRFELPKYALELFIANGVTGIRDPVGDCFIPVDHSEDGQVCIDELRAIDKKVEAGDLIGPRLLSLSSHKVWGPSSGTCGREVDSVYCPATEHQGRRLARLLKARGVDAIKISHEIHPDGYIGLTDEANKIGLEIGGHRPYAFSGVEAADMGHRVFEHVDFLGLDCARFEEGWQDKMESFFRHWEGRDYGNPITESIGKYDATLCNRVLTVMSRQGVYVTTTIVAEADWQRQDDHGVNRFASPGRYAYWQEERRAASADPKALESQRRRFRHLLELTRVAHAADLKLMLGTDTPYVGVLPGISVHEEMVFLSHSGLEPMDILRSATSVPAEYLGRSDLGGIGAGKRANLVLLEKDPLSDIRHSTSLATVIFEGRVFDRSDLERLKENVERKVREAYEKGR